MDMSSSHEEESSVSSGQQPLKKSRTEFADAESNTTHSGKCIIIYNTCINFLLSKNDKKNIVIMNIMWRIGWVTIQYIHMAILYFYTPCNPYYSDFLLFFLNTQLQQQYQLFYLFLFLLHHMQIIFYALIFFWTQQSAQRIFVDDGQLNGILKLRTWPVECTLVYGHEQNLIKNVLFKFFMNWTFALFEINDSCFRNGKIKCWTHLSSGWRKKDFFDFLML